MIVSAPSPRPAPTLVPAAPRRPGEAGARTAPLGHLPGVARSAIRLFFGAAGAVAGGMAGALVGVPVGAVLGAAVGARGGSPLALEMFQPLHTVAGMAGSAAHSLAEKAVGRLHPGAGRVAGAVVGAAVGAPTGALIGVLGMALSGADVGARLAHGLAESLVGPSPRRPDTDPRPTYERGWGPQIPTPDGRINRDQHHWYYNQAAMEVLARDARRNPFLRRIHDFLTSEPDYLTMLQMGGWNLDTYLPQPLAHVNLASFHHFEEPFMPGTKSAAWQARQCYDKAADEWKAGNYRRAMYYLGAAAHLAQDVALPQHAIDRVGFVGKMLGHQMMERWSETQFDRLKPDPDVGGNYLLARGPEEFVHRIAEGAAADYGEAVEEAVRYTRHRLAKARRGLPTDPEDQTDFDSAVYRRAVKRAVRATPGFWAMFFRDMERQGYPIPDPPPAASGKPLRPLPADDPLFRA